MGGGGEGFDWQQLVELTQNEMKRTSCCFLFFFYSLPLSPLPSPDFVQLVLALAQATLV